MNLRHAFTTLAALGGLGAVLAFQALAQNPPRLEIREETVLERRPDGTYETRTRQVPITTTDGGTVFMGGLVRQPPDPESQKLLAEEQALVQEVRRLTDNLLGIDGTPEAKQTEWKSQIREKLAAIFDLQQQRRTREIAKIEERLAKLKDVLKKRDTAKDSIIDRRLETITGGVDELGWEESLPTHATPYGYPPGPQPVPTAPRAGTDPYASPPTAAGPPSLEPRLAPPPVAPRAPPAPAVPPASATPPVAPVPAALPVPASRGR